MRRANIPRELLPEMLAGRLPPEHGATDALHPTAPESVLRLQRQAGNQAVTDLVGSLRLQREAAPPKPAQPQSTQPKRTGTARPRVQSPTGLSITSQDLSALLSGGLSSALGRSSFAKVHEALVAVERAPAAATRLQRLESLQHRSEAWIERHRGSTDHVDAQRMALVERLVDEAAAERARLSREQAQDVYLANVEAAGQAPDPESEDVGRRYALEALTPDTMGRFTDGGRKMREFVQSTGLTTAEVRAIQAFTGNDFGYINPATTRNTAWLANNRSGKMTGAAFERNASVSTMMQEGALHAAVAMSGMRKLPAYTEVVYRGQTFSQASYDSMVRAGTYTFGAFASSSKHRGTAESFAANSYGDVTVIFTIANSGGRDISPISLAGNEQEVTLLAGSSFRIVSIKDSPTHGAKVKEIALAP